MNDQHRNRVLWILQVLLVAAFLNAGIGKLLGDENTVRTFSEIGAGQWFRYLVGMLEVSAAVGLLVPRLCGVAATVLVGVMTGAVATELFLLTDGDPVVPLILLVLAAIVAWFRRGRTIALLDSAGASPGAGRQLRG